MALIFISHSSKDKEQSTKIKTQITEAGFSSIFLDHDVDKGIRTGEKWKQRLYEEIRTSHILLVLLSPAWHKSQWCFAEYILANSLGKKIIPLVIEQDTPQNMQKWICKDIQNANKTQDDSAISKVIDEIRVTSTRTSKGFEFNNINSPYPGMEAFSKDYAGVFFGRDDETDESIQLLNSMKSDNKKKSLIILGASGMGKSSLLKAGILPRIELAYKDSWILLPILTPNKNLLEDFLSNICKLLNQDEIYLNTLYYELRTDNYKDSIDKLVIKLKLSKNISDNRFLLLPIDQSEKLFSTDIKENDRENFIRTITYIQESYRELLIVWTLRTDFFKDFQMYKPLERIIKHHKSITLTHIASENISDIISKPAQMVGKKIQDALVEKIKIDMQTADALPLVALLLSKLYQQHQKDKIDIITLSSYERLSKEDGLNPLEAIVENIAEKAIEKFSIDKEKMRVLRYAFIPHIIQFDNEKYTTRIALWNRLPRVSHEILDTLIDDRLLIKSQDSENNTIVEVSHEALIRQWSRLNDWIIKDREFLIDKKNLEQSYNEYKNEKKDKIKTYLTGLRLQKASLLLQENYQQLEEHEREYIKKSQLYSDTQQKKKERLNIGIFATITLFGLFSWLQNIELDKKSIELKKSLKIANEKTIEAQNNEKKAKEQALIAKHTKGLVLLGESYNAEANKKFVASKLYAYGALEKINKSLDKTDAHKNIKNLIDKKQASLTLAFATKLDTPITATALSKDAELLAVAGEDKSIYLINMIDGERIGRLQGYTHQIKSIIFTKDKKYIISSSGYSIDIWDIKTKKLYKKLYKGKGYISPLALASNGKKLYAITNNGKELKIWNTKGFGLIDTIEFNNSYNITNDIDISLDNYVVASKSIEGIIILDSNYTQRSVSHIPWSNNIAISPDGEQFISAGVDDTVNIWSLKDYRVIQEVDTDLGYRSYNPVRDIQISPNGKWFVVGSKNGTLTIWDMHNYNLIEKLVAHNQEIQQLIISDDGQTIISTTENTLKVWYRDISNKTKEELERQLQSKINDISLQSTPIPYLQEPIYKKTHSHHWIKRAKNQDINSMYNLGLLYYNKGNKDIALKWYEKIVSIEPKCHQYYSYIGDIYLDKKEYNRSLKAYRKAIELDKKYSFKLKKIYDIYTKYGKSFTKKREYIQAIEWYKKAIEVYPRDKYAYKELGELYVRNKEYSKAIESYNNLLIIDPTNIDSLKSLGDLYIESKEYDKAIDTYQKAIEIDPEYYDMDSIYTKIAEVYIENKEYDKAMETYQKVEFIKQEDLYTYIDLGYAYIKNKKYDKAIKVFQKAIELNPKRTYGYGGLINIYFYRKEPKRAIEVYKKAIEKNEEYSYRYKYLGDSTDKQVINSKKIEVYNQILKINAQDKYAYTNLGDAHEKIEKYDKAIDVYQKATEIDPEYRYAYTKLGDAYAKKKEYDKAIDAYQKAIEIDPEYRYAYTKLGDAYAKKKEYDKAIDAYQKAIEINPELFYSDDHLKLTYNYDSLMTIFFHRKEPKRAIEVYKKAIEKDHNYGYDFEYLGDSTDKQVINSKKIEVYNQILEVNNKDKDAYESLGDAYEKMKEYDKAIDAYKKVIEIDSTYIYSYNDIGNMYYWKKEYDTAIEWHQKAIEIYPTYIYSYNSIGHRYYDKKEYDTAIEWYQKAIEIDSEHVDAYNNIGNIYYWKKEYDTAIEWYKKAIEIDPKYVEAYNSIGNMHYYKKEYDTAIEWYKKAIEIDPKYIQAYQNIGHRYYNKKEYDTAIEWYKKAIEIDPKYVEAYNSIGNMHYYKKEYDTAIEWYKKALDIDPKYLDAYKYIGHRYYNKKEYDTAIEWYKKAIEIDPKYLDAYKYIGHRYYNKKEYDTAIEWYKKAIEIDSKYVDAYKYIGHRYYNKKEYDTAIEWYKKAIEIDPKYVEAYKYIGHRYYNKKDYDTAIEWYKKAIEIDPKYVEAYKYIGHRYSNKKEYDKAIEWYNKALAIDPKYLDAYKSIGHRYYNKKDYDTAIEWYKKAIEIDSKVSSSYIYIFKLQLVQNQAFDSELENKYIELFSTQKESFIKYEVLKILQNIVAHKEVDIEIWKQNYHGIELNVGWDSLDKWVSKINDGVVKTKVMEALVVFKKH